MKNLRLSALLGAALLVGATPAAFAQDAKQVEEPTLVPLPLQKTAHRQRLIKIKNVPSAFVAYQLDPKHNPRPFAFGVDNANQSDTKPKTEEKGTFDLPGSVTQIVSVDPQNVVLVKGGSDEDIRRLQELIDVLDQPLRQVEIEAMVAHITPEDAKIFGIVPVEKRDGAARDDAAQGAPNGVAPLTPQLGFVRNNSSQKLNALIAAGKAKIITAPRVTAINNLSATLKIETRIRPLTDGKPPFNFQTVGVDLKTTPTINGDDTITLLINAAPLSASKSDPKPDPKSELTSVINLRDGDTFSLSGLSPLFVPAGTIDPPNTLIFLTARIIRRAGDIINVPGT